MTETKTFKDYCKDAKRRLKSGFWQNYKREMQLELDRAEKQGVSTSKLKEYYTERVRGDIMQTDIENEKFYSRVKTLLDTVGEVSDALGRLTDKEYYENGDIDRDDIKTFFNLSTEGVESVFNLNFLGTLMPTQVFAKQMVGREGCSILNVSSMNAFTPLTKIPAYSGAKSAVSNFTQWLAVHFSKVGIRVNAIAPGFFATKQNAKLLFNDDGTPTARTGKILNATPMGRFGKTEELEGGLLFLLDNKASGFITGVVLPIDGGFSAYSGV